MDVLLVLAARKGLIFLWSAAGLAIAIVVVMLVKPTFTAKALILPPAQEQTGSSALMGQFGALASLAGLGSSLGIGNPIDLYIGILQSQSVSINMIQRFDLMQRYHAKRMSDVRRILQKNSKFVAGKDGMISISVTDGDPKEPQPWRTPILMSSTASTTV